MHFLNSAPAANFTICTDAANFKVIVPEMGGLPFAEYRRLKWDNLIRERRAIESNKHQEIQWHSICHNHDYIPEEETKRNVYNIDLLQGCVIVDGT